MSFTTPIPHYARFPQRISSLEEGKYDGIPIEESDLIWYKPIEIDGKILSITIQLCPSPEGRDAESLPPLAFKVSTYFRKDDGSWGWNSAEFKVINTYRRQTIDLDLPLVVKKEQYVGVEAIDPAVLRGVKGNGFSFVRPETGAFGKTGPGTDACAFDHCGWHVNIAEATVEAGWANWKRNDDVSGQPAFGYITFSKDVIRTYHPNWGEWAEEGYGGYYRDLYIDWIDAFEHLRQFRDEWHLEIPDDWGTYQGVFKSPVDEWLNHIDDLSRRRTLSGLMEFLGAPGERSEQLLDEMIADLKSRMATADAILHKKEAE